MVARHRRLFVAAIGGLVVLQGALAARGADRPGSTKLLPKNTVAYISVKNSQELAERFMQTSLGRMTQQEQLKPLIDQLYADLKEAAAPLEDELGVTMTELLAIPQGEITLAVIPPTEGPPAVVALLDVHEQIVSVERLLDKADDVLIANGADRETLKVGDTRLTVYDLPGDVQRQAIYFERDGTLVVGTNLTVIKSLLAVWDGQKAETLSGNTKFSSIMSKCRGAEGEEPQITWFVDPIELIRAAATSNNAQLALAFLGPLGLDGFQGAGGSMTFATEKFDSINRLHILLNPPRTGLLELVALGSGDSTPEPWVPDDAVTYTTLHWNIDRTYSKAAELFDTFRGAGALKSTVQRFFDRMDIKFEEELLPSLSNRFSYVSWIERPVRPDSQAQMVGIQLRDPQKLQALFDKVVARYEENLQKDAFAGVTYYKLVLPQRQQPVEPDAQPPEGARVQVQVRLQPCFAVLGNYLLISDRPALMERSIANSRDESLSLAKAIDFKLIASKARAQAGGAAPAMLTFSRPEEGLRFMYDLATAEETRAGLRTRAESSTFFSKLNNALEKNPLPPFETLRDYFAPAGGVLVDDATGIHYVSFALRRNGE